MPMTTPQKKRSLLTPIITPKKRYCWQLNEPIFTAVALYDYKADKTLKDSPPKDRTTLVVFIGLLIDLLGKQRNEQPLLI